MPNAVNAYQTVTRVARTAHAKRDRIPGFTPERVLADVELKLLAAGDRFRIRDELRVRQTDTDSP